MSGDDDAVVRDVQQTVCGFDGDLLAGEIPADVLPVFDDADPTRRIHQTHHRPRFRLLLFGDLHLPSTTSVVTGLASSNRPIGGATSEPSTDGDAGEGYSDDADENLEADSQVRRQDPRGEDFDHQHRGGCEEDE